MVTRRIYGGHPGAFQPAGHLDLLGGGLEPTDPADPRNDAVKPVARHRRGHSQCALSLAGPDLVDAASPPAGTTAISVLRDRVRHQPNGYSSAGPAPSHRTSSVGCPLSLVVRARDVHGRSPRRLLLLVYWTIRIVWAEYRELP